MSTGLPPFAKQATEALVALGASIDGMQTRINRLTSELEDARKRGGEAEQRATNHERSYNDAHEKAQRTEDLEAACAELLAALDRLPTKMDDAGIMQTPTPPAIPLYGTYEWEAVMAAKFALRLLIPPSPEKETDNEHPDRGATGDQ